MEIPLKNWKQNSHTTQQSHCWTCTPRKPELKETRVPHCSLQHCLQQLGHGSWRRKRQPTPVLLPGKSHGWKSPVGYSPCGREESDKTEPLLSLFTLTHWKRKWQPTPVFLAGKSQGQRSLLGCYLWDRTGSDITEATQQHQDMEATQTSIGRRMDKEVVVHMHNGILLSH